MAVPKEQYTWEIAYITHMHLHATITLIYLEDTVR
jgi:hypothetical protein